MQLKQQTSGHNNISLLEVIKEKNEPGLRLNVSSLTMLFLSMNVQVFVINVQVLSKHSLDVSICVQIHLHYTIWERGKWSFSHLGN